MNRPLRLLAVTFLLILFVGASAPLCAQGVALPDPPFFPGCEAGMFAGTGASWVICMPDRAGTPWNGDLIIFVHGYVSPYPNRPPEIPLDQYIVPYVQLSITVADLVNSIGYAFATTSLRTNGLAVKDGVADIMDLWEQFKELHRLERSSHVFLFGFSEGGLIAAKAIERHKSVFDGGVAACGPIGDFSAQLNYVGDMRVAFDYYFPGMLPPSPIEIPESLMANWPAVAPTVASALATDPGQTTKLVSVTNAAVDPADPASAILTVLGVLWYNVFGTNDAHAKLDGNPFDNAGRQYADPMLNAGVARYTADRNTIAKIDAQYQTSGTLSTPLVTMHNILDPIVPYEQAVLYGQKVAAAGSSGLYMHIPAESYGHCNFTEGQILQALAWLVFTSGD